MSRPVRALRTEATAAVWESELQITRGITDRLGLTIDKGIEDTVTALRLMGFATSGSCEGHHNWGQTTPWVDIDAPKIGKLRKAYSSALPQSAERGDVVASATAVAEQTRSSVERLLTDFYSTRPNTTPFRLTTTPLFVSLDDEETAQPFPLIWRIGCVGVEEFDKRGPIRRIRLTGAGRREMAAFTSHLIEHQLAPALEASASVASQLTGTLNAAPPQGPYL